MRSFFNWAVENELLADSPLKGIQLPKEQKELAEFLTTTQLERLIACIDADLEMKGGLIKPGEVVWLRDLILVAVCTGLRRGELCNLRWSDVDFETGFLHVRNRGGFQTKSGHERSIPLAGDALEVLQRRSTKRADDLDGYVFTGASGLPLVPKYASKRFKYYVRHTCASWLVQCGVSLSIVQAILGHSSIQVTQRYVHLAPDVMK